MTGASQIENPAKTDSREGLVDEFAELDRQVRLFKPKADRHEFLKKEIKGWFEDHPAEQTALAVGKLYDVQVSAKSNERSWTSMFKLYRALKREKFLEICTVALKAAEQILGEETVAKLVTTSRIGARRLTPVLKAPAELAA